MDVPHCVHVDVPLDYSCQQTFFYINHRDMVASQYEHVYVPSVYSYHRVSYYTYVHIFTDVSQYEHGDVHSDYSCS
jgi:hypothetical protein